MYNVVLYWCKEKQESEVSKMIDIQKEFSTLTRQLNKYKTRPLSFECGAIVGKVTAVNLIPDPESNFSWDKAIEIKGIAGSNETERTLLIITERMKKGTDYKYWREYHVLESFVR